MVEWSDIVAQTRREIATIEKEAFWAKSISIVYLGSLAVFNTSLTMYSVSSVLNIILGGCMVVFHSVGSHKARNMIKKMCCWCCKK